MYYAAACRHKRLLLSTRPVFCVQFNNSTRLWASIGVTYSYSSHPFLCALAYIMETIAASAEYGTFFEAFCTPYI